MRALRPRDEQVATTVGSVLTQLHQRLSAASEGALGDGPRAGEVTQLELQNAINMQDRMHMSLTRRGRPRVATALDVVATARLKGAAGRWRARGLAAGVAADRASSDAREGRPV